MHRRTQSDRLYLGVMQVVADESPFLTTIGNAMFRADRCRAFLSLPKSFLNVLVYFLASGARLSADADLRRRETDRGHGLVVRRYCDHVRWSRGNDFAVAVNQAGGALTWNHNPEIRNALVAAPEKANTPTLFMVRKTIGLRNPSPPSLKFTTAVMCRIGR